jgi:hypothetical protein
MEISRDLICTRVGSHLAADDEVNERSGAEKRGEAIRPRQIGAYLLPSRQIPILNTHTHPWARNRGVGGKNGMM